MSSSDVEGGRWFIEARKARLLDNIHYENLLDLVLQ